MTPLLKSMAALKTTFSPRPTRPWLGVVVYQCVDVWMSDQPIPGVRMVKVRPIWGTARRDDILSANPAA
jgi:hypothetical protein